VRPFRLRRSVLSVPGSSEKMLRKAKTLPADVIMFDLEDSVPVDQKEQARALVNHILGEGKWDERVTVSLRINAMDTPFAYRDVVDVVETSGNVIDTIVLPKVNDPCEVKALDYLLTQIEMNKGYEIGRIGIEASVETAQGLLKVKEIAFSSPRLESLVFGVADYATSVSARVKGTSGHGDAEEFYPGHRWHFPISRMVMAAKAAGLAAIDAPYGFFRDLAGLRRSCELAAALGCDGKWAIHPDQIPIINEVFSPSEDDVERSKAIVDAYEEARKEGKGVVAIDGKMVDGATVRIATQTLRAWELISRKV